MANFASELDLNLLLREKTPENVPKQQVIVKPTTTEVGVSDHSR